MIVQLWVLSSPLVRYGQVQIILKRNGGDFFVWNRFVYR